MDVLKSSMLSSFGMRHEDEAKNDRFAGKLLSPVDCRPRLDTCSTMAPENSLPLSFSPSPFASPRCLGFGLDEALVMPPLWQPTFEAKPALAQPFMLPTANVSGEEELDDPMSRVASPVHKVPRLAGTNENGYAAQEVSHGVLMTFGASGLTVSMKIPGTPVASEVDDPLSPRTPTAVKAPRSCTPPPLVRKSKIKRPALLQALQSKSEDEVRSILKLTPDAATEPFWDHNCEFPLKCALRLHCDAAIVKLLLEYGASPEDGRSAVRIDVMQSPWEMKSEVNWSLMPGAEVTAFPKGIGAQPTYVNAHAIANESWRREVAHLLDSF